MTSSRLSSWEASSLLLAILLTFLPLANAQDFRPASETQIKPAGLFSGLTLLDAIGLAMARNPHLSVVRREWEASRGAIVQAGLRPNPVFAALDEDLRRGKRTTTLEVTQPLEFGGKRAARMAVAERLQDQAAVDIEQSRADVRSAVVLAFFEVLIAQERLRLAQESLALAAGGADAAAKRVQAGKISPVEESRARVVEAAAKAELAQAEGGLRFARHRLFSQWGDTSENGMQLAGSPVMLEDALTDEFVFARVSDSSILKRARLELQRAQAVVQLQNSRRVVDISVTLGAKRSQETGGTAAVIGITVPIPLFDRNQGNIAEALSREEKARDELAATELRITTTVAQAREQLRSARAEALTLQRDAIPGAVSAYNAASEGFAQGKFSYLEALDAQRTLVATRAQYLRALLDTYRVAAELERLLSVSDFSALIFPTNQP